MKRKIAYIHCWYDVKHSNTMVQIERQLELPNSYRSVMFLNPSDASMARLANVITNRTEARICTFADGYTACISPPQAVNNV